MSLMKTLGRVAAGVMLAKGIGAVMKSQSQGSQHGRTTAGSSNSGGGSLLDNILGNNTSGNSGSLSDALGQILGGKSQGAGSGSRYGGPNSAGAQGGLGGLLDSLTKATSGGGTPRTGGGSSGGLGDLLGGILGGGAAAGSLAQKGSQPKNDASFGELFNDTVSHGGEPEVAPTPEQNAVAGLMLKAMIQAAKSDGKIDDAEKQRLLGHLGDELDDDERQFIREQMAAPIDAEGLARDVPRGLEPQVYLMSLLAIDFDSKAEAQYLHDLGQAMGLDRNTVNSIHKEVGVTPLYG